MQLGSGVVVTADEVCGAVGEFLVEHLPAVLQLAASQGWPAMEAPKRLEQVPTDEALNSAETPAIAVFSPGLADDPTRDEDGAYSARWRVRVVVYVRGNGYAETAKLCRDYTAIIRAVLIASRDLDGISSGLEWTGEEYDVLDPDAARTLAGGAVDIEVDIDDALTEVTLPGDDGPASVVTSTQLETVIDRESP